MCQSRYLIPTSEGKTIILSAPILLWTILILPAMNYFLSYFIIVIVGNDLNNYRNGPLPIACTVNILKIHTPEKLL